MRRASPLARRAIPNCQTDGSLPGAEPALLPSPPAPLPSPSAPTPSPPRYGEPPAPRADRPRKSRLYWKTSHTGGVLVGLRSDGAATAQRQASFAPSRFHRHALVRERKRANPSVAVRLVLQRVVRLGAR